MWESFPFVVDERINGLNGNVHKADLPRNPSGKTRFCYLFRMTAICWKSINVFDVCPPAFPSVYLGTVTKMQPINSTPSESSFIQPWWTAFECSVDTSSFFFFFENTQGQNLRRRVVLSSCRQNAWWRRQILLTWWCLHWNCSPENCHLECILYTMVVKITYALPDAFRVNLLGGLLSPHKPLLNNAVLT